jgi:hypothetical protein
MYTDDPTDVDPSSPSATLQAQIERLLVENSVDLVLNGHARLYHQSCPIVQGRCVGYSQDGTALGPVHAMLGIGGAAMPLRAHAAAPYWVVDEAFEHGVAEMTADKTQLTLKVGLRRFLFLVLCLWGLWYAVAEGKLLSTKAHSIKASSTLCQGGAYISLQVYVCAFVAVL